VEIFNFICMHWSSVLLVIVLLIVLLVLYIRGEKKILHHILYMLVTEAERQYGSGTGQLKKAAVIAKIYAMLPAIIRMLITEQRLSELIEEALAYAKRTWVENDAIGTYAAGGDETVPP
jgi:membrane glycosyltransferase